MFSSAVLRMPHFADSAMDIARISGSFAGSKRRATGHGLQTLRNLSSDLGTEGRTLWASLRVEICCRAMTTHHHTSRLSI